MQASQSPPSSRYRIAELSLRDRSIAFLLACFLFSAYMLTYTGVIQSSDGLSMFATAESLVRRGDVDSNQMLWMGLQQGSFGPDGELYSRKGVGMALLAFPLVWLARHWEPIGLVQTALLLNPLLTAWTGGLLYRATIRLGWSRFVAVVTALAYGLATLAWPYTQTFFSDPVAAWGLFGGLYGLLSYSQNGRKRYLFLAGSAWAVAYLARSVNLITLPVYVLALCAILWNRLQQRDVAAEQQKQRWMDAVRGLFGRYLREWILFGLPIIGAGLLSLWWNWLRYGSILETGYLATESFSANFFFGLYGLLVGPARGIIWYSPVLLLALFGLSWFRRKVLWLLALTAGVGLLYLFVYAKWYMWHGGYSWGPRFLVPVLPFLLLLTAPVWHQLYEQERWGMVGQLGAGLLLCLSLGVQWLGLSVPFSLVQEYLAEQVTPLFAAETFTQLRYSPLLLQWRYLNADYFHFAWWQTGFGSPDWLALGLVLGVTLAGGWLVIKQVRGTELLTNWVYGLALLLATLVLFVRYQVPLSGVALFEITEQIESREEPQDAILFLRPAESQQFANVYHGTQPVYGFFPAEELSDEQSRWLDRLSQNYRRLWVVPAFQLPEQSGWERTLRSTAFLLLEQTIPVSQQRITLYALPDGQPLSETGVGVEFGQPPWARLNAYGFTQEIRPGGELLVALEWESLRSVDENYHVFVHLLNEQDERLVQRDGQPQLWLRPTRSWQPGERLMDRYAVLLDPEVPRGRYRIVVGLYDPQTGERQPASVGPNDAVELGPIIVE